VTTPGKQAKNNIATSLRFKKNTENERWVSGESFCPDRIHKVLTAKKISSCF